MGNERKKTNRKPRVLFTALTVCEGLEIRKNRQGATSKIQTQPNGPGAPPATYAGA